MNWQTATGNWLTRRWRVRQAAPTIPDIPTAKLCETVDDIRVGTYDHVGQQILRIYSKEPLFAIYLTKEGPRVQISKEAEAAKEREAYCVIAPLRAEIASLLLPWWPESLSNSFNLRVAAALREGLCGDTKAALATLGVVKAQVTAERQLRGRGRCLFYAFTTTAVIDCVIVPLASVIVGVLAGINVDERLPWIFVAGAGSIGALFSMTIAVRAKTTATDYRSLENFIEGASRVVIGVIAAIALLVLLRAGLGHGIRIGDKDLTALAHDSTSVVAIGFIAGFLERLVPDYLAKT
ncbi:hypothetical protein [Paraburkholderia fynbosensis]|uniref:Uncharacterized protein n=1 Tax=Paraburkholderia fynbosensis TaxID=1200993 RepID=A0A6J5GSD9_9BURK|nr:hypothetical protein [Paraburkholderia fynbosensis]CAB3804570.1 hypothetical protein LMG27177_05676 [Paraburkholderia fynbosensis]